MDAKQLALFEESADTLSLESLLKAFGAVREMQHKQRKADANAAKNLLSLLGGMGGMGDNVGRASNMDSYSLLGANGNINGNDRVRKTVREVFGGMNDTNSDRKMDDEYSAIDMDDDEYESDAKDDVDEKEEEKMDDDDGNGPMSFTQMQRFLATLQLADYTDAFWSNEIRSKQQLALFPRDFIGGIIESEADQQKFITFQKMIASRKALHFE